MKNATLLVVVGRSASSVDLKPLTDPAREHNLHLSVLVLGAVPPIPLYTYEVGAFSGQSIAYDWHGEVDKTNAELDQTRLQIEEYLATQGVSADVSIVSGEAVTLPDTVARRAMACDLMVLANELRQDSDLFRGLLRVTLFQAPTGVLLNGTGNASSLQPETVFVAWKVGLPAARAIRTALPILRAAKNVTVAIFDPMTNQLRDGENPGSDVARWLSHQGCNITIMQYPSGGEPVGTVLLKRAKEAGADLIVMGAYDHSRLREEILGGTTKTLIEQQDCAVLLSH
ncbi:universal stress protein [Falsihalocynthiibacter sp. BN13B15]|uniref:universal stress protein n=1 Tax=Falsihalocynthiibacter sp. BN13B15 TaxID=3240871 RepID=UPI00350F8F5C